jgi:hypothetical protein
MAVAFFQVQLSIQPKEHGEAELILPKAFPEINHQFIIVKEGGEEGIIKIETSEANLKKLENNESCKKLTESEMKALKESYPNPKLKQKYRFPTQAESEPFVVDQQGERLIDTWQTVRSGFYLIDVPVLTQP